MMLCPNDKFATPIVEHTFSAPVEAGVLKWTSKDASIDDISVYALDHTYKAANVGYEQDPNDEEIWISKLTEQKVSAEEKMPTLFIVIYSVIGAVILALLGVIITLFVKKRGKEQ